MDQATIDTLAAQPIADQELFINGHWQPSQSGARMIVTSPIDGQHLCRIADAGAADVDAAVAAARRAFDAGVWSRAAPAARKKVLHKIADAIEAEALALAVRGARDNGTEISMAIKAEPGSAAATFRFYAEAVDKLPGEIAPTQPGVLGLVHREPIGVIGAIIPWNFPLMIAAWKVAPALAAGNSVVLKPSEVASLSLLRLVEICAECGLPDGVLNLVTGQGAVTGQALGLHMDVDVLVFTGSGFVGRKLLNYSAQSNIKRLYLELGGKSPNVVFADAPDLKHAAKVSAGGIFRNSGQVCVAGSRLLVERSIHEEFAELIVEQARAFKVGNPLKLDTDIGALSSEVHLSKVADFVETTKTEGATLMTGGERLLADTGGSYFAPTVFNGVTPDMTLARDEVFGPVLAITPFDTEEEAVALANGTDYGLAAGVWTGNLSRAHRMVSAINVGVVHVNTYGGPDVTVPLGGHKQSGNGHDKSLHAMDKYVNLKTAWIQL